MKSALLLVFLSISVLAADKKISVTLISERNHYDLETITEQTLHVKNAVAGKYITQIESIYHNTDSPISRSLVLEMANASEGEDSELRGLENSYARGFTFFWLVYIRANRILARESDAAKQEMLSELLVSLSENSHLKTHWQAMKNDKDRLSDPRIRKYFKIKTGRDLEVKEIRALADSFIEKMDKILEQKNIVQELGKVESHSNLLRTNALEIIPSKEQAVVILTIAHDLLTRYSREAVTDPVRKMWQVPDVVKEGPDLYLGAFNEKLIKYFDAITVHFRDVHFGNAAVWEIKRGKKIGKPVVLIMGNDHRAGVKQRLKKEFGDEIDLVEKQLGK